ncbi:hypothetical protein FOXG_08620 [Fusarium oxysporum f. sp. lycopersici 4287]|uniref:Uncharacterized protein n=2 Tax=Fusarium oxysporum TaxID=5507 RepID=A0A0J9V8I1_FUSO4|nr:hypothetical protein FOXG_08620 [Fusarium oxysporum f. sp. lycopersici 4287]KNB07465.1 hypothetical protein FOXG_08620 [Fusarium oxysporum f. sp. lycopersici 4287]
MESNVTGPDSQPTCSCRNSSEPVLGQVPEGFPLWRQNEQGPNTCRIPSAPSHSELDSHRLRRRFSETGHHGPGPGLHDSAAGMPHSTLQGHKLHQDSQEWPKWESRGLHESMSIATASLCVDEIEQLVKDEFPTQAQDKPPRSGTTLEQLLSTHDIGKVFSRSK